MQQTADAVANVTKDLTDVDADLVTTLVSGLSYFLSSVAVAVVTAEAASVVTTAVSGLSSCYSSAVAGETTVEAVLVAVAVVAATTCAANQGLSRASVI